MDHKRLWILATAALGACGDGASGGDYEGEPLHRVSVTVGFADPTSATSPRASLVWLVDDDGAVAPHGDEDIAIDDEPGTLTVVLFAPPDASVERAVAGIAGRFALGQIAVYDDSDGDGRWTPKQETLLGVATDLVVVYTKDGAAGPGLGEFAPGFHNVQPAECPALARFVGPATGAHVTLGGAKPDGFFPLVCPVVESYCERLEVWRHTCRWNPEARVCDECAAGIFPPFADPAACDAWRDGCLAAYPELAAECEAEHAVCVAGEPACDAACHCAFIKADCLEYADAETCDAKFGTCEK